MKSYLSKTDIISQMRCPLKLWLDINNPDAIAKDIDSPMIVNGNLAGIEARKVYRRGKMVDWLNRESAVQETKDLMADPDVNTIYEATFMFNKVLVRADILTRDGNKWKLIEVKSTTKLTIHHHEDVAIQRRVLEKAGVKLSSTSLMYINKEFVFENDGYKNLFVFEKVDDICVELYPKVDQAIKDAKKVVKGSQPKEEMGMRCKHNFLCGAKKFCEKLAKPDHISFLPRGGTVQKKLLEMKKNRISQIPNGMLKSETHLKVFDITVSGKERYTKGAKEKIEMLPYPHNYLDFESIQLSVPHWNGVKSWRQVGFQWSNHKKSENGEMVHNEFLDVTGQDPRLKFVESLVKECGEDVGTVFVYNKSFEQMILKDLIEDFPQYAAELRSISDRCFDLLKTMKEHYYSPDMHGSWSIKKVLPCFVKGGSYENLAEVSNGLEAQVAYFNLVDFGYEGDKVELKKNALEYCKYDTQSMVSLVEEIYKREK